MCRQDGCRSDTVINTKLCEKKSFLREKGFFLYEYTRTAEHKLIPEYSGRVAPVRRAYKRPFVVG
ncbi:hypothetical protein HMPREF0080_00705 [Anaeroglobus geminatus F0357]|uniref:Uncharacterized protein n=1 Tax=Anaeroglobus geminatus F0357 TaxID=861450 RepID=G9YGE1_9FIRM|nr:hypothetical protein HMPREF0080_00705 [Anaeroglobus geminatus F0357]